MPLEIRALSASPKIREMLSEVLIEVVANGGSVSFMHPLEPDTAPPAAQLPASDVELEVAKAKRLAGIKRPRCRMWQTLIMP